MSDDGTLHKQAAARRRLQVLQAFVKGRRSNPATSTSTSLSTGQSASSDKKEMRWSPFVAFRRKVVGLLELNASSSDDENETTTITADNPITKKNRSEIFEEVNYYLVDAESSGSAGIICPAIQKLLGGGGSTTTNSPQPVAAAHVQPLVSIVERREAAGTSIGDVQASARDGIDNTGNFHWPTEDITAAYFLNKMAAASISSSKVSVLCELGAGCGLASFAIANTLLHTLKSQTHVATDNQNNKHLIVVTDGNSRVVHTLKRNVKKLYDAGSGGVSVSAAKLPWQCPTSLATIISHVDTWLSTTATPAGDNTDITLFGSDCLFFERFHHELAKLVLRWLVHFQEVRDGGGRVQVLLFAPSRGGSLERFVDILKTEHQQQTTTTDSSTSKNAITASDCDGTINIEVTDDFDENVSRVRKEVAEKEPQFNPDRHLPMLVTISLSL